MVLDAAIVVLENISRLKDQGENANQAALKGTTQVYGALFASTTTTVAIFLPIVFMEEESGQLFADLAVTIAVAIIFSLITAVTVLPTAAKKWFGGKTIKDPHAKWWEWITAFIMKITNTPIRRGTWIVGLLVLASGLIYQFAPTKDYLPEGNRNLVFAFILPPPGVNMDTMEEEMGLVIADRMRDYVAGKKDPEVSDYFFVVFPRGAFMGVRAQDASETNKLVPLVNRVIQGFPDTIAFARRTSLFGNFGGGNTIDVNIQGRNIESLIQAAQVGFMETMQALPGSNIRPRPGLDMADPELRLVPDERAIAEAGWNKNTLADIVRSLGSGLYVGDYFDGDKRLDVILRAEEWTEPEDLVSIPLATPNSGVMPLGDLATLQRTAGPEQIRRIDRRRTITLKSKPRRACPCRKQRIPSAKRSNRKC
jgi:multidrug efflux pump subunit AcrB